MKNEPLDRRALGLALTRLANATVAEVLANDAHAGQNPENAAYRIGFTGPPGAGKSSLVGRLAQLRNPGRRMGVLAIDPSSQKSGGALLGDRIRMDELENIQELYIRSFGSRSASDGLTDNLPELIAAMDSFAFDEVIIETVGVGQAEYAVRPQVDTLVLVLLPDSGDTVQAMKAGIMEMADIFVVNKSDLAGARKMAADVKRIASLRKHSQNEWQPPVLLTSTDAAPSIQQLSDTINQHREFLDRSGARASLLQERAKYRIKRLIERETAQVMHDLGPDFLKASLLEQYHLTLAELASRSKLKTS
ncbi:methylmalonyl Co-A mutase-associated GTPase MeaB [Alcaligenaceae bacterium]|nr:methylmalonyl Co-A mutase-associated GTPase MeaB [Alcaligenaceae bacterium]